MKSMCLNQDGFDQYYLAGGEYIPPRIESK